MTLHKNTFESYEKMTYIGKTSYSNFIKITNIVDLYINLIFYPINLNL